MNLKINSRKSFACLAHFPRRGFVGPLGDDIPSIFPIVAGVLLFFGTIAFAGNLSAEKNAYLDIRKAAVSLSYIVTDKGFVTETTLIDKATALKKAADANSVYVLLTVKRYCGEITFTNDPYDPLSPYYYDRSDENEPAGRTWRAYTNNPDVALLHGESFIPAKESYAIVFNYPIAVPCPDSGSPTFGHGLMNIIVWRKS
ncbi:MAG: hypothetical protein V1817_01115 [Candidatus Micrarchaeota archaeon]